MQTTVAGVKFLPRFVCVSVFPHDISPTNATRIVKLFTDMFQDGFCKLIYFEVKRSKVKNIAGVGLCTLVSAGFF